MWLKGQSFIRRFSQIWVSTRYESKSKLSILYNFGYLVELNLEIRGWLSMFFQNPTIQNPPKSSFFSHLKKEKFDNLQNFAESQYLHLKLQHKYDWLFEVLMQKIMSSIFFFWQKFESWWPQQKNPVWLIQRLIFQSTGPKSAHYKGENF